MHIACDNHPDFTPSATLGHPALNFSLIFMPSDHINQITDHCSLVHRINGAAMLNMSQYYNYLKGN
jgi:hypothetical protein